MKKRLAILLFAGIVVSLTACSKNDNDVNHPKTAVPEDLVGYWLAGSTSIGSFWGYDGSYQGAGFELAIGYMLFKDGRAREYFYYTNTNSGCRTQVLGYKEGTVEVDVEAGTVKFHSAKGNYRGYQTCGGANNGKSKPYGAAELYPQKKVEYKDIEFKKENGKIKSWHIYYDDGSSLDFTKTQEPQK